MSAAAGRLAAAILTLALAACSRNGVEQAQPSALAPIFQSAQRFIVELAPGQTSADLEATARRVLAANVAVEPLFPTATATAADDPEGLSRIYRLDTDSAAAPLSPWDTAYRLRDEGAFVHVEPELNTALEDLQQTAAVSACFGDQGVPAPDDLSWSLRQMRVGEAWSLAPPGNGKAFGEGVRVCHPDTGWTHHVDIDEGQIDSTSTLNLLEGGTNALDPLGYPGNPGHGTATGSVIMSTGGLAANSGTTPPGLITGLAPEATLVPIRAVNSVVQILIPMWPAPCAMPSMHVAT